MKKDTKNKSIGPKATVREIPIGVPIEDYDVVIWVYNLEETPIGKFDKLIHCR